MEAVADEEKDIVSRAVDNLEIYGYIENETALRLNSPHELRKAQNIFQIEMKYPFTEVAELYGRGWLMYDGAYDIEKGAFSSNAERAYRTNFSFKEMVKELYIDLTYKSIALRIGRQQVVWGEAVGLRITDVINPQDFREFILDDFIDSRIPLWMLKGEYNEGDLSLEGLLIPDFQPNKPAEAGSEWEIKGSETPGFSINRSNPKEPAGGFEDIEWGLRASYYLSGWDLSASYFYSWDDDPALHTITDQTNKTKTVSPIHHRIHNIGVTFNNAFGRAVIMGEISYNKGKYFATLSPYDPDEVTKKDFLFYMLGSDYRVSENLLINIQFIQKYIDSYDKYMIEDRVLNIFSLLFKSDFLNETIKPELLVIYDVNDSGFWIRPKVGYDYDDYTKLTIGADLLEGTNGFLGQFNKNDRIFFEVKRSF